MMKATLLLAGILALSTVNAQTKFYDEQQGILRLTEAGAVHYPACR